MSDNQIEILLFLDKHSGVFCGELLAIFSGEDYHQAIEVLMAEGYISRSGCFECAPYDGTAWDAEAVLSPSGRAWVDEYRRNRDHRHFEIFCGVVGAVGGLIAIYKFFVK